MAADHNIPAFTAADIEKYHQGLLTPGEMHALEKAALDDPFLADALEGYTAPGINVSEDIADLKRRLTEKTEISNTIAFPGEKRNRAMWFRIAAMIIVAAGAGILLYRLSFNNNKSNSVAQSETDKAAKNTAPATVPLYDSINSRDSLKVPPAQGLAAETLNNGDITIIDKSSDSSAFKSYPYSPATKDAIAQQETRNDKTAENHTDTLATDRGEIAASAPPADKTDKEGTDDAETTDKKMANVTAGNNASRILAESQMKAKARNIFHGKITDENNNPLPFANVTNISDNVGTYANARGYFTLTSPDSVLNVQVRSVGFNNSNITLKSDTATNSIVMKEDRNSLASVVIDNNRNLNSSRSRTTTMVLEEPEPVDGWSNYDTYLANNLNIPENYRARQAPGNGGSGEVVISFEVDGNGEPINIRVEKSLCESCDKEAMRLVKEGPRFKRKAKKKGRTTVSVSF